ncbi:hypothetical protein P8452_42017 [Trifolium repens]|nr:hypothetical protein P8452_42017 [Trifolium repens]
MSIVELSVEWYWLASLESRIAGSLRWLLKKHPCPHLHEDYVVITSVQQILGMPSAVWILGFIPQPKKVHTSKRSAARVSSARKKAARSSAKFVAQVIES